MSTESLFLFQEQLTGSAVKKERSPADRTYEDQSLPFKGTTDTLKKLIRDEQRTVRFVTICYYKTASAG